MSCCHFFFNFHHHYTGVISIQIDLPTLGTTLHKSRIKFVVEYFRKTCCCCSDVYVVEIAHQDLIRHSESSPPVQVYLQGEKARSVPRNITLFLKAHRPTKWQLISHGIDGKIVVIVSKILFLPFSPLLTGHFALQSDQQVENSDIGEKQSIEVRNTDLPDRLDALLLSALNYGPLVLYARTERASGLDVIVSATKDNGKPK